MFADGHTVSIEPCLCDVGTGKEYDAFFLFRLEIIFVFYKDSEFRQGSHNSRRSLSMVECGHIDFERVMKVSLRVLNIGFHFLLSGSIIHTRHPFPSIFIYISFKFHRKMGKRE